MINQFIEKIKQFAREGLFHIFGSRVIAKVGGLISSMVVVRALEKMDYGYYVSANNLYAYPAIFVGMGMTSVVMQFCSENVSDQRKESIYRHAFFTGNAANILVALAVVGLAAWKYLTGSPQIGMYLLMLSVFPFFEYGESYNQSVLRVKLKNKVFSYSNVANSVVLLLGNIFLTKLFHVPGLIYSRYLAMTVCILFCVAALQKERFYGQVIQKGERMPRNDRRQLNNYAFICAITNFASIVLTLLDITCLDLVLGDPTVLADYYVAITIPNACVFIPSSLMMFFYPMLVSAVPAGKEQGLSYAKQIAKVSLPVNGFIFLFLLLFAPLIIWIIYGQKYMNVVPLFRMLSVNYFVYCISDILGNLIAAIKKVKINLVISVASGLLNILLNLTLIPRIGAIGAAVATVTVTATVALLDFMYVTHHFRKA